MFFITKNIKCILIYLFILAYPFNYIQSTTTDYPDSVIDKITKDNDALFVPGKVLGTGNMSHKITLCSFSISTVAATKIIQAGGGVLKFTDMIEKFPTGKGVTIIG